MSNVAVQVENLGKSYRLGRRGGGYITLRDTLANAIVNPFRRRRPATQDPRLRSSEALIWALRHVSCEIRRGEVVGIVGRNGAGKSTFLKILSRITEPTVGFAEIHGRVGSLLEVGTGFHPELTGRENLYLSGAILGMRKVEIERKFDEIVSFAEVEKFIDTAVKHYSSGMYLRLAFAVAAHLETEVLLVDEVLAVGDATFQKKCLGKMEDVAKEDRTVLFVSHNMGAVSQLCGRALWIDNGQLKLSGPSSEVVASYLMAGVTNQAVWTIAPGEGATTETQIQSVRVLSFTNKPSYVLDFDKPFKIEIAYTISEAIRNLSVLCRITDSQGNPIWTSWDTDTTNWKGRVREPGHYVSICQAPGALLKPGRYLISVGTYISGMRKLENRDNILAFDVSEVGYSLNLDRVGIIAPLLPWKVERRDETSLTLQAREATFGA